MNKYAYHHFYSTWYWKSEQGQRNKRKEKDIKIRKGELDFHYLQAIFVST